MNHCIFCNVEGAFICGACAKKIMLIMAENLLEKAIEIARDKGCLEKMEYLTQILEGEKDYGDRKQQSRFKRPTFRFSNGSRVKRNPRDFKGRNRQSEV